jgi:hypothetical protein
VQGCASTAARLQRTARPRRDVSWRITGGDRSTGSSPDFTQRTPAHAEDAAHTRRVHAEAQRTPGRISRRGRGRMRRPAHAANAEHPGAGSRRGRRALEAGSPKGAENTGADLTQRTPSTHGRSHAEDAEHSGPAHAKAQRTPGRISRRGRRAHTGDLTQRTPSTRGRAHAEDAKTRGGSHAEVADGRGGRPMQGRREDGGSRRGRRAHRGGPTQRRRDTEKISPRGPGFCDVALCRRSAELSSEGGKPGNALARAALPPNRAGSSTHRGEAHAAIGPTLGAVINRCAATSWVARACSARSAASTCALRSLII